MSFIFTMYFDSHILAASSISLSFKLCSTNYTAKKSQKILARTGWLEDIYFVILSADFV